MKIITTDLSKGKFWEETEVKKEKTEDFMEVVNV